MLGGENDITCPAEEIQQMADAVRRTGGLVESRSTRMKAMSLHAEKTKSMLKRRVAEFLLEHVRKKKLT